MNEYHFVVPDLTVCTHIKQLAVILLSQLEAIILQLDTVLVSYKLFFFTTDTYLLFCRKTQ